MKITGLILTRILTGLLLVSPLTLLAQYTQVTAHVVDPNGQPYVNCSFTASFVGQNTVPGHPPYTLGGVPGGQFQQQTGGSCNSEAVLSTRLADNNQISPLPSQWEFTVCDQSRTYCFTSLCTVTGTTMDISGCLNPNAPPLPGGGGGGGGGPVPISILQAATATNNINNRSFQQTWGWVLTGSTNTYGLAATESIPSTNTGTHSAILGAGTLAGSTVSPFEALAQVSAPGSGSGIRITTSGDITTVGSAKILVRDQLGGPNFHTIVGGNADLTLAGGASLGSGGTGWIANNPFSSILQIGSGPASSLNGGLLLFANTGLTVGSGFTPTQVFSINGLGVINSKSLASGANSCLQADPSGNITITGLPCGSGGGGGGAGGFGYIVPNSFTTISSALTAAQAGGSGPVVVLPTSTDTSSYVNTTNIRIDTYKQDAAGQDSRFFRDVSEWGRIDGKTMTCNAVAGSNSLICSGPFVNSPAPQGDVGKLIMVDGAGPQTGQVNGTITVASTAGVTPQPALAGTWQGVIFNDSGDGCNTIDTMPYAFVTIDPTGMPTGSLHWTQNFYGKGCTRPPTSGTVMNITGTVTFNGGTMVNGDLVSTITAVTGSNIITIADNALVTVGGAAAIYGTDVHDTFQAACNSMSKGGQFVGGSLTFSGIGLTSKGIDCNSAALHIIGNGFQPLNAAGAGSTLVYAGKGPNVSPDNPTYVLNLAYGAGSVVERVGIRGNSQAMPYGIMLSYGTNGTDTAPGSGQWINQMGKVDQAWIGWEWGDSYGSYSGNAPRLQSCIFSNGPGGNNDFWNFDRIYCYGADVGVDSVNNQATAYHFGKLVAELNNIGIALIGGVTVDEYYTEFNRVDFTMGSPYWGGGNPVEAHIRSYGGESSAMETENPVPGGQHWTAYTLKVDEFGLGLGGGGGYSRPDGYTSDYRFLNNGYVKYLLPIRGKIYLPETACGAATSYGGLSLEFSRLTTPQITWWTAGPQAYCSGYSGGGHLKIDDPLGSDDTHTYIPLNATDWYPTGTYPLMLDVNHSQTHIGSLNVQSPSWGTGPTAGYGNNVVAIGATGSTTYKYQITCIDSLGNETIASPNSSAGGNTFTVTNGNATLNSTNYNQFTVQPREGCPGYTLYGDNGIGGVIGYLATLTVEQMQGGVNINDQGKWTKDVSRHPPTTPSSGSINAQGNLTVSGLTTLNNVNITGTCSGTGCGTGGGGSMVYPTAGIANSTGTAWGPSYTSTPGSQIPSNFIPTLNQSTTGNAATATQLAASPPQCPAGNFAIGITANGSANCQPSGGGNAQVVIATGTTPLTIKTPDGNTNIAFNMVNLATPSITSSTGAINLSDLIISDLAGTGTALLQADSSGNVSRSTASAGIGYPPATNGAGIAVSDGTQWLANYNASNPIPSAYIPILNQPTTANAGTATALAGTPTQCTTGQFPTGILSNGNATGCTSPTAASTPVSSLTGATVTNIINNSTFPQTWNWTVIGTGAGSGFGIGENVASTNSNPATVLLSAATKSGSTIGPFSATAQGGSAGLKVTVSGDIQAQGTATFIGPHRLPGFISAASLATDGSGNIVVGSAGGGMTWPTSTGIAVYNGSSAWTTSYSSTNPIPFNYLSTTVPLAGACTSGQYQTASSNTGPTCGQVQYSQLGGTVPTWNQSTTGNAATSTNMSTNGTGNQVWAMNAGGTAQGWQSPASGTPTYPRTIAGTVNAGGIPYATSTTNEAYSGTLGAGQVVLGGGSGNSPTTTAELDYITGSGLGTLGVGTTGGNTGVLQLNGTTSGNFTMTPSATSNSVTLGGSGYTSLFVPAGSNTAVAIGTNINSGLYFTANTVAYASNSTNYWTLGSGTIKCNGPTCNYGNLLFTQNAVFQSGIDQNAAAQTGGNAIFRSAQINLGAISGAVTGNATLQSGDNNATGGASQTVGSAIVTSGGFTGASGATAAWTPGYTQIQQKYWADTTVTVGTLACYTTPGTNGQMPKVGTCTTTATVPWIGIIVGTQGQAVIVEKSGHAAGVLSNAAATDTAGYFVCVDTTHAGQVTVGTTLCGAGLGVGIIDTTGGGTTSHSVDVERF